MQQGPPIIQGYPQGFSGPGMNNQGGNQGFSNQGYQGPNMGNQPAFVQGTPIPTPPMQQGNIRLPASISSAHRTLLFMQFITDLYLSK